MNSRPQIKVFRVSGPAAFLLIPLMLALVLPLIALLIAATAVSAVVPGLALPSRLFKKISRLANQGKATTLGDAQSSHSEHQGADRKLPDIEVQGKHLS